MNSYAAHIILFCLFIPDPSKTQPNIPALHLIQNLAPIHNFFANGHESVNNRYPTSPATSAPLLKTDSIPTAQVSWERTDLQNASDYIQEILDRGTGKLEKPITVSMPIEIPPLQNPMTWNEFRTMFPSKTYGSPEDEAIHKEQFEKTLEIIHKHNWEFSMGMHSYTLGVTKLADMTDKAYQRYINDDSNSPFEFYDLLMKNGTFDEFVQRAKKEIRKGEDQGNNNSVPSIPPPPRSRPSRHSGKKHRKKSATKSSTDSNKNRSSSEEVKKVPETGRSKSTTAGKRKSVKGPQPVQKRMSRPPRVGERSSSSEEPGPPPKRNSDQKKKPLPKQHDKTYLNYADKKWKLVGPVREQGKCGSCWAHVAANMAVIIHAMVTGEELDFSPQHLIDCDNMVDDEGNKNEGCKGGYAKRAMYYIRSKGIALEEHYKYEEKTNENCHQNKLHSLVTFNVFQSGVPFIKIDDNEPALREALIKYGPLMVSINASLTTFKNYKYVVDNVRVEHLRVYADPKCTDTGGGHGMIVVGCGTDPLDGEYWILKNSWDVDWGKNGYMWMAAKFTIKPLHEQTSTEQKNKDGNMCGIASMAFRPNVLIPNFPPK